MIKTKPVITLFKRTFFNVIPQYKKGIRLFLGKYDKDIEPGFNINLPFFHTIHTIRTPDQVFNLAEMDVISQNGVTYKIDGIIRYAVNDAKKAILAVDNIYDAVPSMCRTELRTVLGTINSNAVLTSREYVSSEVKKKFENIALEWGINLKSISISDIKFDESMKKAMAISAEAEQIGEGKKIHAKADTDTAEEYKKSAKIYEENPISLRLREYQLVTQISQNPASTILMFPSDIASIIKDFKK